MKQRSLAENRFDCRPQATKRQRFLAEMDAVIPWARLAALVEPVQPIEQAKARIRSKVEHPLRVIKRQFGYLKTRYRGLVKNRAQIVTLFALLEFLKESH